MPLLKNALTAPAMVATTGLRGDAGSDQTVFRHGIVVTWSFPGALE
jgi:hypothetical protein